jgi:hypothetical protein
MAESKWVHADGSEAGHPVYRRSGSTLADLCRKCGAPIVLREQQAQAEADTTAADVELRLTPKGEETFAKAQELVDNGEAQTFGAAVAQVVKAEDAQAAHKVRWFATIDGERKARTGAERGEVRWDAECSCGFTTGEPKVFRAVRKAVNEHKGK